MRSLHIHKYDTPIPRKQIKITETGRREKEQLEREERHESLMEAMCKKGETVEKLTKIRYNNYQKTY